MEEFGRSQASLAEAVGKSRSHVANTVRLLSLPAPVRRRLDEGELFRRPRARGGGLG
jgi:ParB family chromosome partitioning protein